MTTLKTQTVPTSTARRRRRQAIGVVVAHGREKTIAVRLERRTADPKYGKYLLRRTVVHVHDERNEGRSGQRVEIAESRPISKTKRWRLVRVLDAKE